MRQTVQENRLMRVERILGLLLSGEDLGAMSTYSDVKTLFKDLQLDVPEKEEPISVDKAVEGGDKTIVSKAETPNYEVEVKKEDGKVVEAKGKKKQTKGKRVTINTSGMGAENTYVESE